MGVQEEEEAGWGDLAIRDHGLRVVNDAFTTLGLPVPSDDGERIGFTGRGNGRVGGATSAVCREVAGERFRN